ncbi:MAG: hypothetical protein P8129_04035 [Anaerolineae bacterium]
MYDWDLVRIDVADAGHERLVHEGRLDHAPPVRQQPLEFVQVQAGGVRSQVHRLDPGPGRVDELDLADLALRDVGQVETIGKVDEKAIVLGLAVGPLVVLEVARHAKVEDEPAGRVELDQEVLAVALRGSEGVALQPASQPPGRGLGEESLVAGLDLDAGYLLMEGSSVQVLLHDLHVG